MPIDDLIYCGTNPCAEIALPTIQFPPAKKYIFGCCMCHCPYLVSESPVLRKCMGCGHISDMVTPISEEAAESWRQPIRFGAIDVLLS